MATAAQIAARLANDIAGLQTYTDLTATTAVNLTQNLIDLLTPQYTADISAAGGQRGHLDQMSPQAHRQLMAELTALKARFTTLGI